MKVEEFIDYFFDFSRCNPATVDENLGVFSIDSDDVRFMIETIIFYFAEHIDNLSEVFDKVIFQIEHDKDYIENVVNWKELKRQT